MGYPAQSIQAVPNSNYILTSNVVWLARFYCTGRANISAGENM